MSYESTIKATAERTGKAVAKLLVNYQQGLIGVEDFQSLTAQVVSKARAKGVSLAQLSLDTYVREVTGHVEAMSVISPADTSARLAKAVETVLQAPVDDQVMKLSRVAVSEVLEAGARAYSEAIRTHRRVDGWTRGIESDACQLCQWWWREGEVWAKDHPMPTHKGCACTPVPVMTGYSINKSLNLFEEGKNHV